jgi:hypothetical protein
MESGDGVLGADLDLTFPFSADKTRLALKASVPDSYRAVVIILSQRTEPIESPSARDLFEGLERS